MRVETTDAADRLTRALVLDGVEDALAPAAVAGAAAEPQIPAEAGRLPLGRLGGLAASGAFAFWTSLTCFVC